MRTLKYIIWISIVLTSFTACTEKIDIELDSTYARVVIDAAITDKPGTQQIYLSYTADYFSNTPPLKVSGALVALSDGVNTWMMKEEEPGAYQTPEGFLGSAGSTYSLTIQDVDLNGEKQSFSATSSMPFVPPADSILVEFVKEWGIWGVKLYALDPPSTEFYLFKVYCNGILVSDTIDRWRVVSDDFFNGNYTYGVITQWLRENEAQVGDTISLEMASIPEGYARFIWEVQQASGYNNPLFSGPPANVRSNFTNGAIGYFATYSTNLLHTVIKKK